MRTKNRVIETAVRRGPAKDYSLFSDLMTGAKRSEKGCKPIEPELRHSEVQYRRMVENSPDVICTIGTKSPYRITYVNAPVTRLFGYSVEQAKSISISQALTRNSVRLALQNLSEDLENAATGQNHTKNRSLELEVVHSDGHTVPVDVSSRFLFGPEGQPEQILAVIRDVSERKKTQQQGRRALDQLVKAMGNTMEAMAMIVEMKDPYTAGHQRRVTELACAIAKEIGLQEDQITGIRLAGLVHDIGKVHVPAKILTNLNRLSNSEFSIIKMHPLLGHRMLKTLDLPWPIAEIVCQHHERIDGSGYPAHLTGKDISLEAKILAVADVVEAMVSDRPYRPALGISKAMEEISREKGKLFDPRVVDSCFKIFREKRFKFTRKSGIEGKSSLLLSLLS